MRLGLGQGGRGLSASTQTVHPKPRRLEMPFVTFTVRRGLSAADKSRLSEAMLDAQVAAGYHRADRFHRFLEVDPDDLLVDPRFPDYATDRTDRFMVVEIIISSGWPTGTAATIGTKRSDCSASACTSRLRTFYSPSTRWSRTSRAFLLRRSDEIRPRTPKPSKRDQFVEARKSKSTARPRRSTARWPITTRRTIIGGAVRRWCKPWRRIWIQARRCGRSFSPASRPRARDCRRRGADD